MEEKRRAETNLTGVKRARQRFSWPIRFSSRREDAWDGNLQGQPRRAPRTLAAREVALMIATTFTWNSIMVEFCRCNDKRAFDRSDNDNKEWDTPATTGRNAAQMRSL